MRRINHLAFVLLTLLMAFSLVGCGTAPQTGQSKPEQKIEANVELEEDRSQTEHEDALQVENENNKQAVEALEENKKTASSVSSDATRQQETVNKNPNPNTGVSQNKASASSQKQQEVQNFTPKEKKPESIQTVTISIFGPKDYGAILNTTKVEFAPGDTVLDILEKVGEQNGFEVETTSYYGAVYVEGIDGFYEGDFGGQSGWIYKLNGTLTPKSAGNVKVKDGDKIVWEYVED